MNMCYYSKNPSFMKQLLKKTPTIRQGGGQEEDQREVACIAQLVRVGPLIQEVPGSSPSVPCSTKSMYFTRFIVTCS